MKVETNLKSGAFLQDVAGATTQAASEVGSFFGKAGEQAQSLSNTVVHKATGVWNALLS
jgi:hypothetical protein